MRLKFGAKQVNPFSLGLDIKVISDLNLKLKILQHSFPNAITSETLINCYSGQLLLYGGGKIRNQISQSAYWGFLCAN